MEFAALETNTANSMMDSKWQAKNAHMQEPFLTGFLQNLHFFLLIWQGGIMQVKIPKSIVKLMHIDVINPPSHKPLSPPQ